MDYDHPSRGRQPVMGYWPLVLFAVLVGLLVWRFWPEVSPARDATAEPRAVVARGDLAQDEKATIELFKTVSPSVVHITTRFAPRRNFNFDLAQIPEGTGSGFIWDDQGRVVTNYHVIQNASTAQVTLSDNTSYNARLVGGFPDKDLAVLHIDAPKSKLRPILIGTSQDLLVGQKVFAIGNPFGLDRTLTTGIISALGREIQSVNRRAIKDVIQTDAAINPGNSGGPLLDSAGRLIGVNTAILSPSGESWTGIGFAIPVDEVNRIVPQLIRHGKIVRPGLGVQLASDQMMREAKVNGALIVHVQPGSAAEKAGLRPTRAGKKNQIELGDIITAIDTKPITSVRDLFSAMESYKVGDLVTVTVIRNDQEQKIQAMLQAIE